MNYLVLPSNSKGRLESKWRNEELGCLGRVEIDRNYIPAHTYSCQQHWGKYSTSWTNSSARLDALESHGNFR